MADSSKNSLVVTVTCKRGKKPIVKLGALISGVLFTATMLSACSGNEVAPVVEPVESSVPSSSIEEVQPQMQGYEVAAFRSAIETLQTNYSNRNVLAANLQSLSSEVTKLNARLALDDKFSNEDEIKKVVSSADALVSRVDLADPTVTVDDMEKAGTELESLKQNLGIALENYQLTPAVVDIERIDLAVTSFDGFVGDAVVITPAVYPTMVKDADLSYTSTDENVVVVDENGSGTLTGVGSAEIVVTDTASGVEARFAVTSQAVPQAAKPTTNTQQQQPSGGSQSQTPSGGGTGNNQQGGTQQQQPSSGAQNNTGGSTGGAILNNNHTEEELRELEIEVYGMTLDELHSDKVSTEEYARIMSNIDWGY